MASSDGEVDQNGDTPGSVNSNQVDVKNNFMQFTNELWHNFRLHRTTPGNNNVGRFYSDAAANLSKAQMSKNENSCCKQVENFDVEANEMSNKCSDDSSNGSLSDGPMLGGEGDELQTKRSLTKERSVSSGYQTQDSVASMISSSQDFSSIQSDVDAGNILMDRSLETLQLESICSSSMDSEDSVKTVREAMKQDSCEDCLPSSTLDRSFSPELSFATSRSTPNMNLYDVARDIPDPSQSRSSNYSGSWDSFTLNDLAHIDTANIMIGAGSGVSELESFLISSSFGTSIDQSSTAEEAMLSNEAAERQSLFENQNPGRSEEVARVLSGLDELDFLNSDYDVWNEAEREKLINILKISLRFRDIRPTCEDILYFSMRALIKSIKRYAKNGTLPEHQELYPIIWCITDHSDDCEPMRCDVPWCTFFQNLGEITREKKVAALLRHYRRCGIGYEDFTDSLDELPHEDFESSHEFYSIDSTVHWSSGLDTVPVRGVDYYILSHLGKFGERNLQCLSTTLPPLYMQIAEYTGFEGSEEFWNELSQADYSNKPASMVHHLWVLYMGNWVKECLIFNPDKTLDKFISTNGSVREERHLRQYTSGLLSAVDYLSKNGFLYLSWKASGIQIDHINCIARLADFSYAAKRDYLQTDEEIVVIYIASMLPQLLPPEIFSHNIGEHTDVWGIGCTLFHLATGNVIHHRYRYMSDEAIREKIQNMAAKDVFEEIQTEVEPLWARNLLGQIFTEAATRKSAEDLQLELGTVEV